MEELWNDNWDSLSDAGYISVKIYQEKEGDNP